jgi:prepilin-type N-terminal cleavage/methylation domain-containing protein
MSVRRWLRESMFPRAAAGGFTLVEMAVAVAVTGVLLLGIGSAMLLAGRAVPEANSPAGAGITAAGAVQQMMTELPYATAITQRSANLIEFAVPDRNADDVTEAIRYEWSGTSGAPLTRQYNGGTPACLLADVREFHLSYDLKTVTTFLPQQNESAETILAGYDATEALYDCAIRDGEWYGEYFLPALPADAVSWKVVHVALFVKQDLTSDGEASVQLQLATAGKLPSGTVLEEKPLLESTLLPTYLEQEFAFSNVGGLAPQQGLCLVVRWIGNGTACKVRARSAGVTETNLTTVKSTDYGATWVTLPSHSLLFRISGTVVTAGSPQVATAYHLDATEIRLRAGGDSQATVETAVRMLNRPEVTQ